MSVVHSKYPDFIHTFIYSLVLGKHFIINTGNYNHRTGSSIEYVASALVDFLSSFKWIKYRILDCSSADDNYFAEKLESMSHRSSEIHNRHEVLIIIPSNDIKNNFKDGVKIAYFLQSVTRLTKNVGMKNGTTFSAVCVSNMDVLNQHQYLYKQFWLCCSLDSFVNQIQQNQAITVNNLNAYYLKFIKTWSHIQRSGGATIFHSSLRQYILDIVVHLRVHRFSVQGKAGGAQTNSLKDMTFLAKLFALTPFIYKQLYAESSDVELDNCLVTPDFIKQACFWYFPFKLQLSISKEHMKHPNFIKDPSILYGSDSALVDDLCNKLQDLQLMKRKQYQKHYNNTQGNWQQGAQAAQQDSHEQTPEQEYVGQRQDKDHVSQTEADFFFQLLVVKDVLNNVVPPF
ncbi:hypothetical protein ACO0RG_001843 [Hanseniaspora osmophila]